MIDHLQLSMAIYEKFYETAKRRGLFWTMIDWVEHNHPELSEEEVETLSEEHPHRRAIQTVLAYEISYFVYRHLNGPWGEMVDFFLNERNHFCNEYREKTGYQVVGNDDDLLY